MRKTTKRKTKENTNGIGVLEYRNILFKLFITFNFESVQDNYIAP